MKEHLAVVESIKKHLQRAKVIARLVLLSPIVLTTGCGYSIRDLEFHDHEYHGCNATDGGKLTIDTQRTYVSDPNKALVKPYNPSVDGEVYKFIQEGHRVPYVPNSRTGKRPIHRHGGKSSVGPWEYKYE